MFEVWILKYAMLNGSTRLMWKVESRRKWNSSNEIISTRILDLNKNVQTKFLLVCKTWISDDG
jgi:hypothetical protein